MSTDKSLTAGVLGGMGPDATVDFMARVVARTEAGTDQDHVHMLVDHNPQVPDRQAAMRGDGAPVNTELRAMAQRLAAAGADFLVMPCNTAHAFLDGVAAAAGIPLINLIDATVAEIDAVSPAAKCIGLLATSACLEADLYQRAIARSGRDVAVPDAASQSALMKLIVRIKSGDRSALVEEQMARLANGLLQQGAELIIAGCTEIPLVLGAAHCSAPVVSSTEVLARRTVALATGKLSLPQ